MKYNLLHKIWLIFKMPITFFCVFEGKILLKIERRKTIRNQHIDARWRILGYEKCTAQNAYVYMGWEAKRLTRNIEVVIYECNEAMLDFIPQPNYFPEKYTEGQKKQMEINFLDTKLEKLFRLRTGNLSEMHKKEINEHNMLLLHTQRNFAIDIQIQRLESIISSTGKSISIQDIIHIKQEFEKMNPLYALPAPIIRRNLFENIDNDKFIKYFFPHHEHNSKPDNQ